MDFFISNRAGLAGRSAAGAGAAAADASAPRFVYVQEYAPPATIEPEKARARRAEAFSVIPEVLDVPRERAYLRTRRKQKGGAQYEKLAERGEFEVVAEGGLELLVNFTDYLDTGLFLDHRITRSLLREAAKGARFLNLFAYTGSATVYAAAGGARETTTVDMSATYLEWAQNNLAVNGFEGPAHELIQDDCIAWLKTAVAERRTYDLIFLDPPTFSNSKRMDDILDVQRDHADLVHRCMALLAQGGKLVFSNNAQKFKLDGALTERYAIKDITRETLPRDFERNPRIHQCFEITARG